MVTRDSDWSDTIIAIATPPGQGALGVVRVSGREALNVAQKLFQPDQESGWKPWHLVLGKLIDQERKEYFDEATAVYFPAPQSYTREDMVEIICHGSQAVLEEVVRLGIRAGARLAHPGEFTLRAYLNGRIDLLQAEAVNDLIRATSLSQARLSFRQLEGRLSRRIESFREELTVILSEIEAAVEFPEEGIELNRTAFAGRLEKMLASLEKLLRSYDIGRALLNGVKLAIVGRANVGKSTLFNALVEKDRAIVSPFPGTTRDYLEEKIKINDMVFTLIDMAGISEPGHPVEEEGIRRARSWMNQADGLVILLDTSQPFTAEDERILASAAGKRAIIVLNKIDLPCRLDKEIVNTAAGDKRLVEVSALKGTNVEALRAAINEVFGVSVENWKEEVIFHWREKATLEEVREAIERSLDALKENYPEEVVAEELHQARICLGKLIGEIRSEDIINNIFSQFCVGK
ncbi:MAG: tRNA uridine-5-carboxymethylaminomethyl(34) synthesis GTPase MnmE [Candidatus Aminicenantales bacterium]